MTADRLNAKPQPLYVATDGRDEWSGRRPYPAQDDGPFRSLERARDEIRRLRRGSPDRRLYPEIHIRGGRYELPGTFTLTAADGGAPGHPVVYRARANERVTLTGGRHCRVKENAVPAEVGSRLPPAARDRVVALDTGALGGDLGEMQYRGKDVEPTRGVLELFVAGRRIPMARWPNRGWERVARRCRRGKGFYYRGGPRTWQGTAGAWLHGFWRWDWADFYLPVESVCAKKRLITVSRAPEYGFRSGARYRVVNVLEELDQPGEWYLDGISNAVYLWPPEGAKEPVVSALETILRLDRTSHVVFAGIDFDASRGNAIEVNAGAAATFRSCSVRNSGGWGIAVNGGERHCVDRCEVADTGTGGVLLAGGDRASLAGAGHRVANCDIRRFGAVVMSYSPGVRLEGVGNCATGNRISDGPHSAVILSGNEHRVEGNDIRDVCNQTADAGAVYLGRDWTMRGNAIRGNIFRCIRGLGGSDAKAVYLDDCASGTEVAANHFHGVSHGVFIGGGRDNVVERNRFVACRVPVHVDARGLTWARECIRAGGTWRMVEKLKQVRPEAPPYSRRYPQLARLLRENPGLPRGNRIAGNSLENQGQGARANRVRCAIASCCRRIGGLLPGRLTRGRPGGLARRLVALSAGKAGCSRTGIELVGVPGGAVVTDVELTGIRRRGAGIGAGIPAAAMLRRVAGKFASYLTRTWRSGVNSASAKRTFDVAVASVGLIFALPVMAVAAAAMRAASPGPILFRQQRIGRHGRRFAILKLRTMSCAGPEGSPAEKAPAEVTLPGRVLRRWSIDELPQLINVLKGEMSLVGPRPYPAAEALRLFGSGSPRTAGLPGITGLSQVSGRKELTAEEVLRLDREYLSRRSLPYDIVILARTLPAVIRGRGAY